MIRLSVEELPITSNQSMLYTLILKVMQQMTLYLNQCSRCEFQQLLKRCMLIRTEIKIHIQDLLIHANVVVRKMSHSN